MSSDLFRINHRETPPDKPVASLTGFHTVIHESRFATANEIKQTKNHFSQIDSIFGRVSSVGGFLSFEAGPQRDVT